MSAHATAPAGAQRPEFIPYVYGSASGRPSAGRPERVLANAERPETTVRLIELEPYAAPGVGGRPRTKQQRTTTRKQEETVGNGRIDGREGRVTARNAVPGGTSRNGLPEPRRYVYQGTGKDPLTPSAVMAEWERKEARRQDCCGAPRPDHFSSCETAAALLAGLEDAGGLMAPTPAPEPCRAAPRPEHPQSRALDNIPDKRAPEIESPQAGDTGRPDKPADNSRTAVPSPGANGPALIENAAEPEPVLTVPAAPVPTPARRHRKCGYPLGSIGHQVACGGPS